MAVLKVKVVSIIGRMNDLDNVTSVCGKSGIFHPDNSLSFYSNTSDFSPLNEENPYAELLQRLNEAVTGARKELKLLNAKETDRFRAHTKEDDIKSYVKHISASLNDFQNRRAQVQQQITAYSQSISEISHFVGHNLNLTEINACEYIKVRFGSLPKESYEKLNSYDENPYVIFFPCTMDETVYWGVYFSPLDMIKEVDRIFSSLYFVETPLNNLTESPEKALESIRSQREDAFSTLKAMDAELETLWKAEKDQCQKVYSWLTEQSVYFGIRRYASRYNDSFILTGWIPANKENQFRAELDPIDSVEYTFDTGANELVHSPPVKLKNKGTFKPFEFFINLYGMPSYDEVDPTAFVAITYTILFGIMFGDFGQGLCVSIIGYIMWKFKRLALGKALIPCGLSSAFFGLVFGSVFGFEEALNPLYKLLFNLDKRPISVMEPATTNMVIVSAVAIGISLVIVAMCINIYTSLKRKHYGRALFGPNGVAGLVFYGSLAVGFGGQVAFGWHIVNLAYILCCFILPLVVIIFSEVLGGLAEHRSDWKPESWGGYIMQQTFELFEVLLSYASNTISFLRVGAFVLVHAGMMMVVFTLADMSTGIAYVLVVMIGNAFVMALEGLLVGIQTLRLEFYEMFSRFFDGEGRPFTPVTVREEA
ncbi:MAG TPA: V-type ATPase 116kDa subunit family protein [Oscillospiraceae bacterium]|nr:V-type ATPase 116kDa subunit family protein [Oscillospiraceae bacterium]